MPTADRYLESSTDDVHTAVQQSCAALAGLTDRMRLDLDPLSSATGSVWQSEVDRLASNLAIDSQLRERIEYSVLVCSDLLLTASVDYAKGMAHAIAGGSLYSGHALARCVSEGIGLLHWMTERPTEVRVLLGRALVLLIESHSQEEKRVRLAVEAGEGDPSDGLEALRDTHAAKAAEYEAVLEDLGVVRDMPKKSDVVANLSRAARMSGFPTVEYRLNSAFAHFEPLVLLNSLDYEWQSSDGERHRTMSVMGLLTPVITVTSALRRASEIASSLFEFNIGADAFDRMEDQLRYAYINHGPEQGADLRER